MDKKPKEKVAPKPPKPMPAKLRRELFPQKVKLFSFSWVFFLLALVILSSVGIQIYRLSSLEPDKPEVEIMKIDLDYIDKLNKLESFGDIPSPDEPGFGKDDPFSGI